MPLSRPYGLYLVFMLALVLNISFWMKARHVREPWENVPAVPTAPYLSLMAFGDDEVAYRMTGYFLQNLGSSGGRFEPLKDYDFKELAKWMFVANELDANSNYIPYLAAYYFSATQNKEQVFNLIDYLDANGKVDYPEKWRWSAQAVYLAQFIVGDDQLALKIANELAKRDHIASWAKQLPAFINLKLGNKAAAYGILLSMLDSERATLPPQEVNAILDIICHRTLNKAEAKQNPLCQNLK